MRSPRSALRTGEVQRRLVHASGASVPLAYGLGLVPWSWVRILWLVGAVVALGLEALRLFVGLDWAVYDRLTREYEQDNPAGYALYMVSMALVALVFPPHIAVPGMLMLAVGDPISGLLGSRTAFQTKSVTTLAVMFLVCFALASPFLVTPALGVAAVGAVSLPLPVGVAAAALGAAGATLADGIKPVVAGYVVDDNFSIPPAACVGIWAVLLAA